MSKRSLGLDAIRLTACVMVVAFHASVTASMPKYFGQQVYGWLFEVESIRMPLFFVLSGYLMSTLYLSKAVGPGVAMDFLLKRLKKIYPLYWAMLGIMSLATFMAIGFLPFEDLGILFKTIMLMPQDPRVVGGTGAPIVYPAWVLQYEMVAYTLIAMSLLSRAFFGLFLFSWPLVYIFLTGSDVWLLSFLGSQWFLIFWFGVVLGQILPVSKQYRGMASVWAVGLFAAAQSARLLGYISESAEELIFGLAFCGLIVAVRSCTYLDVKNWVGHLVRTGSDASYAIFLIHIGVVSAVCRIFRGLGLSGAWGHLSSLVVCLTISFVVGVWVNRHVEPRIARLLSRSPRAERPTSGARLSPAQPWTARLWQSDRTQSVTDDRSPSL